MKSLISLTSLISIALCLNSCSRKDGTTLNNLPSFDNQEYFVSLEKPISLKNKKQYNLHWDSNLPESKIAYNLSINGKIVKKNLTETVVSAEGSVFEFNVPVKDYFISSDLLDQGNNDIQIIAEYEGKQIRQSNKVEIKHDKSSYLALR